MLASIFQRYATHNMDCSFGTDKNTVHSYADLYESLLGIRRPWVRSVLEIGICSGGSLCAWADFFPEAEVTGVDVTFEHVIHGKDNPRIHMVLADGTKKETADMLGKTYDFVLDDGSHNPDHQIASLEVFLPCLNPGGIYIIEDIAEVHADRVRRDAERVAAACSARIEWHDLRSNKGRFDDIVAVFYK